MASIGGSVQQVAGTHTPPHRVASSSGRTSYLKAPIEGITCSVGWVRNSPASFASIPSGIFPSLPRRQSLHSQSIQRISPARRASSQASTYAALVDIGITDKQLEDRGFKVRTDSDGIDLDQLNLLFGKVGFPKRQKPRLEVALQNTPHLLWLEDTQKSQIVGFARATGDQVFNAIIWDVVVDPKLQGTGLGKALMERLLVSLLDQGICNIALFAEPQVVQFYKALGFMADPDDISCMALRRRK